MKKPYKNKEKLTQILNQITQAKEHITYELSTTLYKT